MTITVLISGRGSNMMAVHEACARGDLSTCISHVISNNIDAPGLQYATRHNIKTSLLDHQKFTTSNEYDDTMLQLIEQQNPRLVLLAGFMRRLGAAFTEHFKGRLLNIHPSILPRHPGLHTHDKVLQTGDRWHGCSVHFVTEVLDGGPVIARSLVRTQRQDTPESLAIRVLEREHQLYWRVVRMVLLEQVEWRDGHVQYNGNQLVYPLTL